MDRSNFEGHDHEDEVQPPQKRFVYSQILRKKAGRRDLLEPPNNVEAFRRLEAAMDEVKQQNLDIRRITSEYMLFDPPTTAERFARIEAAIDDFIHQPQAPSSLTSKQSHLRARSQLQLHTTNPSPKVHHLLKKRSSQPAGLTMRGRTHYNATP